MDKAILRSNKRRLIRTLRCKNRNVVGTLGHLITLISTTGSGADIGMIKTYAMGEDHNIRDISVMVDDEKHLKEIIARIKKLENIELLQVIDEVMGVHQGGKIKVQPVYPVESYEDLRKVYTPGVAEVCVMIKNDPEVAQNLTSIAKNVALVTNGSRVLGLGNMGPVAAMPVMEGKASLFTQFTGYNMFPILIDSQDPKEIIATVMKISKGFGAIQLEDISTPACFEIETELKKHLKIPIMHDDQHGTAVVALAAMMQACRLAKKDLPKLFVGQVGLGAAGQAIAQLTAKHIGRYVLGCDASDEAKKRYESKGGRISDLETIMQKCDLIVATTGKKDLIKPEMIRKGQIILALSNPYPEISAQEALEAGAAFAADGTRVNNLLGFPGIFKGAMQVRATSITEDMLLAAAKAIADSAPDTELVPNVLDKKLHERVAHAVSEAAFKSGVARLKPEVYYHKEEGF